MRRRTLLKSLGAFSFAAAVGAGSFPLAGGKSFAATLNVPFLYELRRDGSILHYVSTTGSWEVLDTANRQTRQLMAAGGGGELYKRNNDGSIYAYNTTTKAWDLIGNSNPKVIEIAGAITGTVYQLLSDGSVWQWQSATTWKQLTSVPGAVSLAAMNFGVNILTRKGEHHFYSLNDGQLSLIKSDPRILEIAASEAGTHELDIDGKIFFYGTQVDNNPLAKAIVTNEDDNSFYQLQRNGVIKHYTRSSSTWSVVDTNPLTTFITVDEPGNLFQLRADGSVLVYTGSTWQLLDKNPAIVTLVSGPTRAAYR